MSCEQDGNKKYYWLKLHRDFFKRHDIQVIEAMPNGKDYILFYLKLLVESIDHEGSLRFSDTIPYSEEMLSSVTHTNIDVVRSALGIFRQLEMITIMEDATIFMAEVDKMIGKASQDEHTRESTRERVRAYRERKKVEALPDCYSNVTCNGEIEKEIEKELDKDIISEVVAFLNQTCGCHYQASTPKTRSLIKARIKEGFTLDDFKTVITKMNKAWGADAKMKQYLRPETLFGTKFEGYLNRPEETEAPKRNSFGEIVRADYDLDALEKMLNG